MLDEAAADLAAILADDVGGFAVPIMLTDPDGNTAIVNGLATDIGLTYHPESGVAVSAQKISVALPISALDSVGIGRPRGIGDRGGRPWFVTFKLPNNEELTYKVASSMPDALGCLICFVELYNR